MVFLLSFASPELSKNSGFFSMSGIRLVLLTLINSAKNVKNSSDVGLLSVTSWMSIFEENIKISFGSEYVVEYCPKLMNNK